MQRIAALLLVASLGLVACGDDGGGGGGGQVSDADFRAQAVSLCERYVTDLTAERERLDTALASDADRVAFITSDYVPAARAVLRSLAGFGTPEGDDGSTREAIDAAAQALRDLQDRPYEMLDGTRSGRIPEDEDPFVIVDDSFAELGVVC